MGLWSKVKSFFTKSSDLGGDAGTGFTSVGTSGGIISGTTGFTPVGGSGGGGGTSQPAVSITIVDSGGGRGSQLSTQELLKQDLQVATGDLTQIQKFEASKDLIKKAGVLEKAGLSKEEAEALAKRELMRREAKRRGKGFTKLEAERFLGGGKGVKSLRIATSRIKKARVTGKVQEFLRDIPEALFPEGVSTTPPYITPTQFGVGDITRFGIETFESKEVYSPQLGAFISPSPTGFGTTGYIRQPTPKEKIKIEEAQKKGDLGAIESPRDVVGLGTQYIGGYVTAPLTKEEKEKLVSPLEGEFPAFLDPRKQYEVFKSRKEYDKAIKEAYKTVDKLEKENSGFQKKWGDYTKGNEFTGTEKQYGDYQKDYQKLSKQFDFYTQQPDFQKAMKDQESRKTIHQRIKKSDLSPQQKDVLSFGASFASFIPFIAPPLRVLYGVESVISGTEELEKEDLTAGEQIRAMADIGIGAVLVKSGFRGGASITGRVSKIERDLGIRGGIGERATKLLESRTARRLSQFGLPVGISGLTGYDTYEQTEDLSMAISSGAGALASIGIPMVYGRIRRGEIPTTIEKRKLIDNLNKLENSIMKDFTLIRKGAGRRPNSDRVDIIATQKSGGFARKIKISGDLIKKDKGFSFFPEGKGKATTFGTIKVKGQTEKGFTDVQIFDVQQLAKGINLGEFRGYDMGTTQSITKYQPKLQVSRFFKVPKGRGLVIKSKEGIDRIKQFLERKQIRRGGKRIIEIETELGRTLVAKKRLEPPETEPFQTQPKVKEFDITEPSRKLGKIIKEKSIEERGYIFSEKRLGEFLKLGEPIKAKEYKIKKRKGVKKTPLEKTFGEPEIKSDLDSPQRKAIQIKKTKDMVKELEKTDVGKVTETIRKGLKGRSQKVVEKLDVITTDIPKSVLGGKSRARVRLKAKTKLRSISEVQQKARLDTAVVEIPRELQKEKLASRQAESARKIQRLIEEPIPIFSIRPKVRPPKKPKPVRKLIPLLLRGKRKIVKKKEKKKGYNVFIKRKGKYRKVTPVPINLISAKDLRAYGLDRSTSRSGRILPTKKYASPTSYNIPRGYARDTRQKFRGFKQKKGKKTKLKRTIIERGKYLIDSVGEKKELGIFKLLARREKKRKQQSKNLPIGLGVA